MKIPHPPRPLTAPTILRTFAGAVVISLAMQTALVVHGATLLSKAPNAAVYIGLPFANLEFENPLSGGEMILSHKVLDWRDADYKAGPPPWYDDWSVFTAGGTIDGNANEIWMRMQGQYIQTATTVPSRIVSIHLVSDANDGIAAVKVDGTEVARLDMFFAGPSTQTALIVVQGLSNATHTVEVDAAGVGQGGGVDVAALGAAALKESDIKWNQPPTPATLTSVFYGWNQPSMEYTPPIAADDWVCTTTNPITKIRWWGSFLNWQSNVPPALPQAFWIHFWTDVPKGADPNFPGFSHPGILLSNISCQNYTWQFTGWDYDPQTGGYEACFLFEQTLTPDEWFYQQPGPTGTNIYWISISAVMVDSLNKWGWKTRPRDVNSLAPDDAVVFDPNAPPPGMYAPIWWPDPDHSWDLAFELISSYTNVAQKWFQPPDTTSTGWDVNDTSYGVPAQACLLADDFICRASGPLTDISIWGSWRTNAVPPTNVVSFTLSIHKDVPVSPTNTYSMPGPELWTNYFAPGQYQVTPWQSDYENWFSPGVGFWFADHVNCFRYDFHVATNAFVQTSGNVYWLDVQAQLPPLAQAQFGWKTTLDPYRALDAAVWANGTEQSHGAWTVLYRPQGTGQTMDLAFAVTTSQSFYQLKWSQPPVLYTPPDGYNGWNQLSVEGQQIVADDWACTNATPVTDIHWWGSFIGWGETNPPQMPDAFQITIWNDVPTNANNLFSHPGALLQQIYCTNSACNFVGWDFDPRHPGAPPDACFKFDQDLLPGQWFTQDQAKGTNIYWISIAAVYINGAPSIYPWGWKTRPHDPNSLAPDDAVYSDPASPVGWLPIEYPAGTSWDMAFALTTQTPLDFGDAPSPFPTLLANDGARHIVVPPIIIGTNVISPGVVLGTRIDAEPDGQPNANATGDDNNNLADEDGVILGGGFMIPGDWATLYVSNSVPGHLSAWVDFNADGSWATPGDQIFTNVALPAGTNTLYFYVPQNAAQSSNVFARFRFSTQLITNFTGLATDGEVEDYMWPVAEVDYGDAPDPTFPTLHASNGARHWRVQNLQLGTNWDREIDGQPNATATGDDMANLADEDGVTLLGPLLPGQPGAVQVFARMPVGWLTAPLNAWIDFGADGSWATPGDQICTNAPMVPGPNLLTFNVPANAAAGSNVFARFRFSTAGNLSYTNAAGPPGTTPNGEVEDYMWRISQLDFGDAPDPPFPTYLTNNGARHVVVPGFCLGSLIDGESDGRPNATATGDPDDDGVVFVTPLVIGTQACVNVVLGGTNNGKLDAWIDFNTNGSWLDTGEPVFTSQALVPGTNHLCFTVPASALPGPTFARFRLSSAGGLSPTGQANDGEVEDYRVTLGWQRPSTNIVITNVIFTSKFNGWNEPSVYGSTNIAADDWVCTTTNPVTDIRWWGSFLGWQSNTPPTVTNVFHLTIWSDVPKQGNNFSHPGQVLWETDCTNATCQFAGWDVDPQTLAYEACFRFDQRLGTWFYQTNGTGTNIYWLSIAAVYPQGAQQYVWGWKTRPRQTNSLAPDDAVRISSPTMPHININNSYISGGPICWPTPTDSWDLAFELVSSCANVIDKWEQLPDLTTTGVDVNDTSYGIPNPPPYLLADDFQCHSTGPLTDITIWGSWTNDWETPQNLSFTLSIHKDVPAQGGTNSMPGQLLWQRTFAPGQYQYQLVQLPYQLYEGWLTPPANYIFPADHACFQCDFHVATNAFVQTNGTIYWLDVQAQLPLPAGPTAPAFGWKTSVQHSGDDAVWVNATEPFNGNTWKDLRYPPGHQFYPQSIDLAFRLANSQPVYQLKWSQPPLANSYLTLQWNAENNIHYQVQTTTNLVPPGIWLNVGPELIGPVHEQSDTNTTDQARFYRVIAPNVAP